jgi:hypothetical protein
MVLTKGFPADPRPNSAPAQESGAGIRSAQITIESAKILITSNADTMPYGFAGG